MAKLTKVVCADCGQSVAPDMASTKTRCKVCASKGAHEKRVAETYGLKPGQYDELLAFQGGGDAVTGQKPRAKRLAVDHDHQSGAVRGLLLKHTNFYVIGWLESFDDPFAILDALAEYLRHPPAQRLWGDDTPKAPSSAGAG